MDARIEVTCACGRQFRLLPDKVREVRCHFCGGQLSAAGLPETAPAPGAVQEEPFEVECGQCWQPFEVPADCAGKRVRCPACAAPVRVPATRPAPRHSRTERETPAGDKFPNAAAVGIGVLASIGSAVLLGFLIGFLVSRAGGRSVELDSFTREIGLIFVFATLVASLFGGYIAARLAGFAHVGHASLVGVVLALLLTAVHLLQWYMLPRGRFELPSLLYWVAVMFVGTYVGGRVAASAAGLPKAPVRDR